MARAHASTVVQAAADRVWSVVRDFNGMPDWHPQVAESRIEAGCVADQIGCVRNFKLKDGATIRERLLGLSDYDLRYTYSILESPMELTDYVATLALIPVTDGNACFVDWEARFVCAADKHDELTNFVSNDVFAVGLAALRDRFA